MTALILRGMAERRLRSALTALAVLLGVAMIAGTYIQTDRIGAAFEDIQATAYAGADVVVQPAEAFSPDIGGIQTLDAQVLERVRAVPGVAAAEGWLGEVGSLVIDGERVEAPGAPTLVLSQGTEPFSPVRIETGRLARGPGEVIVDKDLFRKEKLELGQRVGVATRTGVQSVTVVGSWRYGDVASIGGAQVIAAEIGAVQRWYDREGEFAEVLAAAEEGVAPEELAGRVRASVGGAGIDVSTGDQRAEETAAEINDAIGGFLTPALLTFAGVAVLVGAFIIFNTFSITVAQRTREFAVLRAVGASRRQIVAAVVGEALLIGAVASVAGIGVGIAFAEGLAALFDAAGWGIPAAGLIVAGRTVAVALAVGIGVTVLAALVPALRATRVPPVMALTGVAQPSVGRRRWVAPVSTAVVGALGLAALLSGLFGSGPATARLGSIGAGAVLLFIGIALGARWFVRPLAGVIGWPVERLLATPGRLARENSQRSPGRTATTSAALMVGIGLVVFVAVFAAGLKGSIERSMSDLVFADLVITDENFAALPEKGGEAIAGAEGVAAVTPFLADRIEVNGRDVNATTDTLDGVDVAGLAGTYRFEWLEGSDDVLAALGPGDALVEEQFAEVHGISRGDTFRVQTPSGPVGRLRAVAVYRDPLILQGTIVTEETFRSLSALRDPFGWFVAFEEGADPAAVQARVERALEPFPTASVRTTAEYTEDLRAQTDQLVYMLYALLAMSVVISLFGIANSLFLSIHERTREFGLLRAVGATRAQIRRIVRYESVITSVIGGLLGIVIGVVFAALVTAALSDLGLSFSLPAAQIAGFLVLAVIVGMAGAIVPARRGSRLDVLEALRYE